MRGEEAIRGAALRCFGVACMVGLVVVLGAPSASFAALPDGRGYELVSPPNKLGGDVRVDTTRTRAAVGGGRVAFTSLTAFGDAAGSGGAAEYLATRDGAAGTQGWVTHASNPAHAAPSFGGYITAKMEAAFMYMSPDLSKGIYRVGVPVAGDAMVANVVNLYLQAPLGSQEADSLSLVTDCSACNTPLKIAGLGTNQAPVFDGASADQGHILFSSTFALTADAPPQPSAFLCSFGIACQPRAYEWDHGTVRLVGILPDGTPAAISVPGNDDVTFYKLNALSGDGTRAFFTVPAAADSSGTTQLYMRTDHTTTVRLSASERNPQDPNGAQAVNYEGASADGRLVFFTTAEALTADAPIGNQRQLYAYDTSIPDDQANLTLVSKDGQPPPDTAIQGVIGTSTDGSYVYFVGGPGQLVSGAPDLGPNHGIFLAHAGTVRFVGQLTGVNNAIDDDLPQQWALSPWQARVTPDGRHLLFASYSGVGLTGYDHGDSCGSQGSRACRELYLFSADDGSVVCVSCRPDGTAADSDASTQASFGAGGTTFTPYLNHPLSDDGKRVWFTTGDPLVADDHNGAVRDAYEYDADSGTLHLISSGTDTAESFFLDSGGGGQDVYFATSQKLVGWDKDSSYDLYDARVGGGLPDPIAPPEPCAGDTCQGAAGVAPDGGPAPGSAAFDGGGNVHKSAVAKGKRKAAKQPRCKTGHVRRRVGGKSRCVKKATAKRARASRPAAGSGGGK